MTRISAPPVISVGGIRLPCALVPREVVVSGQRKEIPCDPGQEASVFGASAAPTHPRRQGVGESSYLLEWGYERRRSNAPCAPPRYAANLPRGQAAPYRPPFRSRARSMLSRTTGLYLPNRCLMASMRRVKSFEGLVFLSAPVIGGESHPRLTVPRDWHWGHGSLHGFWRLAMVWMSSHW